MYTKSQGAYPYELVRKCIMLVTGLCFHERFMFSWINSQIFALLVAKSRVRADIAFFMLDARVTSPRAQRTIKSLGYERL